MRKTPLRKMSKAKARETRKYWPLRRKFLEEHPFCELDICGNRSTNIHHMKGQAGLMMNDTRYFLAVCVPCHDYIESHKNEMRAKGIILYK